MDTFLTAAKKADPTLRQDFDALPIGVQNRFKAKIKTFLDGIAKKPNPPPVAKSEYKTPGIPSPYVVDDDNKVLAWLKAAIIGYRLSGYHVDGVCEPDFQTFAAKLSALLAANPPNYKEAIAQVTRCIEGRTAFNAHMVKTDALHQTMVDLLTALRKDLIKARDAGDTQLQVTLYQYAFPGPPAKNGIYDMRVEGLGPPTTVTENLASLDDVKDRIAVINSRVAYAKEGGRRTRRRHAFKTRARYSRKRVSRRSSFV